MKQEILQKLPMKSTRRSRPWDLRYRVARAYYRTWRALGGPDFLEEIDYWEGILSRHPSGSLDPQICRAAFPIELRSCAAELRQSRGRFPKLLEIGSGPLSVLSAGIDEELFAIVAIDPLARPYRRLLTLYDIKYPIEPVPGRGESLVKQFPPASFDVVYSSNALDHTTSPRRCLEQMCLVVRPGGFLLLEGFVREGSHGNWKGLHQHDLFIEQGCLIHVNRNGNRTNLTADQPVNSVSERICKFKERTILAFGYETPPDMPTDAPWDWRLRDWYTLLLRRQ